MTSPSRRKILTAGGLGLLTIPLGGPAAPQAYGAAGRPATRTPAVALDVISDIQGGLADLGRALDALKGLGDAHALVIAGDLVAQGTVAQYEELYAKIADHPHPDRVLAALGNHEQYNADPFDTQVKRFLEYTGMP
ncbi:metallophosphoesterase, partial [Streptomyces sp. M10]|uniref:metallophosphoesterase n=1 Tax=Streptomyces sp. M10 TaxID=412968 RepID=UPI001EF9E947